MRQTEVAIVGGGVAGCAMAYELARLGAKVMLLEQHSLAWGASGRNMGGLMNSTDPATIRAMRTARSIYAELANGPVQFAFRRVGKLLVTRTQADLDRSRAAIEVLRQVGETVDEVDPAWVRRELGPLRMQVAGAFMLEDVWAMNPAAATRAFAEAARSAGADIRCATRVGHLDTAGGRVRGLVTDDGRVAADVVVAANGPWLADLTPTVPVTAAKGWILKTWPLGLQLPYVIQEMSWPDVDELGWATRAPTLAELAVGEYDGPVAESVLLTPDPDGSLLIGASMARSLGTELEGVGMPQHLARRTLDLAPGLETLPVRAAWYGLRPMTPDGAPVVGAVDDGALYVHGGHGSIGMLQAPTTARWLAASIWSGTPSSELDDFAPSRFSASAA